VIKTHEILVLCRGSTHVSNRRCFFTTRVVFLQQAFFVNIACCDATSVVFSETTIFVDFHEFFLIFLVFLQQALFFYNKPCFFTTTSNVKGPQRCVPEAIKIDFHKKFTPLMG
jgi:hypothetical protein